MPETTDATFYRSPAEAIAAPPEKLAYVAAFDPAGQAKDAMAVLDTDPSSPDYGRVVGWSELRSPQRSSPPRLATRGPTPSTAAPAASSCSTWAAPTATTGRAGSP
jgi:hypothetical protein